MSLFTTNGKEIILDKEDEERLSIYNWIDGGTGTVYRNLPRVNGTGKQVHVPISHDVLKTYDKLIDHVNINYLDNRKANLRPATYSQNGANKLKVSGCSSKYKGVYWHKLVGKWKAEIRIRGKKRPLGYFTVETNAALA